MGVREYRVGDRVVYAKQKVSDSPGPRAADIVPAASGDSYSYLVDKFWIVTSVNSDGTLTLKTRRGKEHSIPTDDPRLRPASWWEKMFYAKRFEPLDGTG